MKRSRIHVLIVEDDASQGKAYAEVLSRAGYQAVLIGSSAKALTIAQRQEFHCLIVDCMLPKMNGVDLVEELLEQMIQKPKVFLVSGIFKDRNFVKEAVEKTGALNFLFKPFPVNELVLAVDEAFAASLEDDDPPLLSLYGSTQLNAAEVLELIQRESPLDSVHLPRILKCIQRTQLTGELTLVSSTGDVSSINFWQGQIFSVRSPDRESYFGGLAVSFGFVSPEDVEDALKNPSGKLLGQKLVESLSISPHAVHVIMEEQLALRLSQTLQGGATSLQWTNKKFPTPDFALNPLRFETLANDWIASKMEAQDIKSNLEMWSEFQLHGDFHPRISQDRTIEQLLNDKDFEAPKDIVYLFRQLLNGHATISGKNESAQNFDFLEHRLDKLIGQFKTQNYFQILGVGEKAHSNEVNKAYSDLKEYFDPAKLPADCPAHVVVKCTRVFQNIEAAYKSLADDLQRAQYLVQLQNSRSQKLLEAEPILRAAIIELQSGQPKQAARKLQTLLDQKLEFRDLRSYRIWAGLKCDRHYAGLSLEQVPPEERHSAPYFMAKGIYYRTRGRFKKAMEAFRTAHVLDPRLDVAKRELSKIKKHLEKTGSKGALLSEVTSVVENLFGKISRRGA